MRSVAHTGSLELFRLAVLAIALEVAFGAAELFGVSFALGAFFAGMILSESQLSQRAAQETLPLRDAFAVLFFVSIGMLFDPTILASQPNLVAIDNSIGYVEYAQATKTQLNYALLQNSAGKFVKPEPASFQAAAATADWANTNDFYQMLTNAPGETAYPITATVFVFMRKKASWMREAGPRATSSDGRWNAAPKTSK